MLFMDPKLLCVCVCGGGGADVKALGYTETRLTQLDDKQSLKNINILCPVSA